MHTWCTIPNVIPSFLLPSIHSLLPSSSQLTDDSYVAAKDGCEVSSFSVVSPPHSLTSLVQTFTHSPPFLLQLRPSLVPSPSLPPGFWSLTFALHTVNNTLSLFLHATSPMHRGRGVIVNISTGVSDHPLQLNSIYSAAKVCSDWGFPATLYKVPIPF